MEMRLPPVASSWHVPPNLDAFAPLDDDAQCIITRWGILYNNIVVMT